MLFSIGIAIFLALFWLIPGNNFAIHSSLIFAIGFFVFGPQMLVGMVAAELSHREAAGTSSGFVGLFAYFGAALSGYPIGVLIHNFSWYGFFIVVGGCAMLSILLLIPLWKASGHKHIKAT